MDTATGLTAALILGALTYKAIDLVKYVVILAGHRGDVPKEDKATVERAHAEAKNGLITLGLGSVVGVVIVLLFTRTGLASDVAVGNAPLSALSMPSLLALGLAMTSVAGVLFDGKKALDNTDTASKTKLTLDAEAARQGMVDRAVERL